MNQHDDDPMRVLARAPLPVDMVPSEEHVACLKEEVLSRSVGKRRSRFRVRRDWLAVAGILLAVGGMLLWPRPEKVELAQNKLTPAADWIHVTYADEGDGEVELWLSLSLGIKVYSFEGGYRLEDIANCVQYWKRPGGSTIYRVKWTPENAEAEKRELARHVAFYTAPTEPFVQDGTKVMEDVLTPIEVEGRQRLERAMVYEINKEVLETKIVYDAATKRAVSISAYHRGKKRSFPPQSIDYPTHGPATLEGLGIDDADEVVDGFPPAPFEWSGFLRHLGEVHHRLIKALGWEM